MWNVTGLELLWAESLHVLTTSQGLGQSLGGSLLKRIWRAFSEGKWVQKTRIKQQWPFGENDPPLQASAPTSAISCEALVMLLCGPWWAAELGTEKPKWAGNVFLSFPLSWESPPAAPEGVSQNVEGLTHCENTPMPLLKLRHPYSRHPSLHPGCGGWTSSSERQMPGIPGFIVL